MVQLWVFRTKSDISHYSLLIWSQFFGAKLSENGLNKKAKLELKYGLTYNSDFGFLGQRWSARSHSNKTRVSSLIGHISLEQGQGPIPEVVKAEPDPCLFQRLAIFQPEQLHLKKRSGIGDALELCESRSLDDDSVLWWEENLGSNIWKKIGCFIRWRTFSEN